MARAAAYRTQNPKEASLLLQWSSLIHIVCDLPYLFDHGIRVSFAQIALRFSDSQQYVNKGVSASHDLDGSISVTGYHSNIEVY